MTAGAGSSAQGVHGSRGSCSELSTCLRATICDVAMTGKDAVVVLFIHPAYIEYLLCASQYPWCQGSVAFQGQDRGAFFSGAANMGCRVRGEFKNNNETNYH